MEEPFRGPKEAKIKIVLVCAYNRLKVIGNKYDVASSSNRNSTKFLLISPFNNIFTK